MGKGRQSLCLAANGFSKWNMIFLLQKYGIMLIIPPKYDKVELKGYILGKGDTDAKKEEGWPPHQLLY